MVYKYYNVLGQPYITFMHVHKAKDYKGYFISKALGRYSLQYSGCIVPYMGKFWRRKSLLMKQLVKKNFANLLAVFSYFTVSL